MVRGSYFGVEVFGGESIIVENFMPEMVIVKITTVMVRGGHFGDVLAGG